MALAARLAACWAALARKLASSPAWLQVVAPVVG